MGANNSINKMVESSFQTSSLNFQKDATILQDLNNFLYGEGKLISFQGQKSNKPVVLIQRLFPSVISFNSFIEIPKKRKSLQGMPFFIPLLDIFLLEQTDYCSQYFKVFLTYEYHATTLKDLIDEKRTKQLESLEKQENEALLPFSQEEISLMLEHIIQAYIYLCNNKITHRLIKPASIAVEQNVNDLNYFNRKHLLSDVGFLFNGDAFQQVLQGLYDDCYLSPEELNELQRITAFTSKPLLNLNVEKSIMQHREIDGQLQENFSNAKQSTVFSLAMIALEMATLKRSSELYDFNRCCLNQIRLMNRLESVAHSHSKELAFILGSMMHFNPIKRITIENTLLILKQTKMSSLPKQESNPSMLRISNFDPKMIICSSQSLKDSLLQTKNQEYQHLPIVFEENIPNSLSESKSINASSLNDQQNIYHKNQDINLQVQYKQSIHPIQNNMLSQSKYNEMILNKNNQNFKNNQSQNLETYQSFHSPKTPFSNDQQQLYKQLLKQSQYLSEIIQRTLEKDQQLRSTQSQKQIMFLHPLQQNQINPANENQFKKQIEIPFEKTSEQKQKQLQSWKSGQLYKNRLLQRMKDEQKVNQLIIQKQPLKTEGNQEQYYKPDLVHSYQPNENVLKQINPFSPTNQDSSYQVVNTQEQEINIYNSNYFRINPMNSFWLSKQHNELNPADTIHQNNCNNVHPLNVIGSAPNININTNQQGLINISLPKFQYPIPPEQKTNIRNDIPSENLKKLSQQYPPIVSYPFCSRLPTPETPFQIPSQYQTEFSNCQEHDQPNIISSPQVNKIPSLITSVSPSNYSELIKPSRESAVDYKESHFQSKTNPIFQNLELNNNHNRLNNQDTMSYKVPTLPQNNDVIEEEKQQIDIGENDTTNITIISSEESGINLLILKQNITQKIEQRSTIESQLVEPPKQLKQCQSSESNSTAMTKLEEDTSILTSNFNREQENLLQPEQLNNILTVPERINSKVNIIQTVNPNENIQRIQETPVGQREQNNQQQQQYLKPKLNQLSMNKQLEQMKPIQNPSIVTSFNQTTSRSLDPMNYYIPRSSLKSLTSLRTLEKEKELETEYYDLNIANEEGEEHKLSEFDLKGGILKSKNQHQIVNTQESTIITSHNEYPSENEANHKVLTDKINDRLSFTEQKTKEIIAYYQMNSLTQPDSSKRNKGRGVKQQFLPVFKTNLKLKQAGIQEEQQQIQRNAGQIESVKKKPITPLPLSLTETYSQYKGNYEKKTRDTFLSSSFNPMGNTQIDNPFYKRERKNQQEIHSSEKKKNSNRIIVTYNQFNQKQNA